MFDPNSENAGVLDLEALKKARQEGKKIGLVQGSWDLFHLGHLKYLLEAKKRCDYLIVGMDSDLKIKKRKGPSRPIIPEQERYEFIRLLPTVADDLVIKKMDEQKWGLIKDVRPDVLIVIKENYTDEQLDKLREFCKEISVLPRQSTSSTSDKIRQITISASKGKIDNLDEQVKDAIECFKKRIGYSEESPDIVKILVKALKDSTDWKVPVATACYKDGKWYTGANHADFSIPKEDVINRTELFYATTEHAEISLLKRIGNVTNIDFPIYSTLFPCDKCMKTLIDKGVKQIYYMEDHPNRNWSKRSHELAEKAGVQTIQMLPTPKLEEQKTDFTSYKFIYPPNARHQEQLNIMLDKESRGIDPLDPEYVGQDILFRTQYWYVTENKFPYEGAEKQFLIVAVSPVYNFSDITDEMLNNLYTYIIPRLETEYGVSGGSLCVRFGDCSRSGASLKRIHFHLIQPKIDSKVRFGIGGKQKLKEGLHL